MTTHEAFTEAAAMVKRGEYDKAEALLPAMIQSDVRIIPRTTAKPLRRSNVQTIRQECTSY